MTDPNLLNEVARIIDPEAFEPVLTSPDAGGGIIRGFREVAAKLALSKASQVLVLVEGWSNSSRSRPGYDGERAASAGSEPSAQALAQRFHETYERLAPAYGYQTREASAKPWADVPEANQRLMVATCDAVLAWLKAPPEPSAGWGGINSSQSQPSGEASAGAEVFAGRSAEPAAAISEGQIKHMVNRFLGWRLPEDLRPDCGITFDADAGKKLNPRNARYEPNGTNLFDATQAEAMVRYMIEGLP